MKNRLILLLPLLLTACGPSGVTVYDDDDVRVGEVVVDSTDRATVYDRDEITVGRVRGQDVFDRSDVRVGRVKESGARIDDRDGNRVGRLRDGKHCIDRDDGKVGEIASVIDAEAAGGACLLLLLR